MKEHPSHQIVVYLAKRKITVAKQLTKLFNLVAKQLMSILVPTIFCMHFMDRCFFFIYEGEQEKLHCMKK